MDISNNSEENSEQNGEKNAFNEIYLCDYCKLFLDEPVTLPCGETICKSHINDMQSNELQHQLLTDRLTEQNRQQLLSFNCKLCENMHRIDEFSINKKIKQLVDNSLTPKLEIERVKREIEIFKKLTEKPKGKFKYYL
jgi:hypothetical protein